MLPSLVSKSRRAEIFLIAVSVAVLGVCLFYTYLEYNRPLIGDFWATATWQVTRSSEPDCQDDQPCLRVGDQILEIDGVSRQEFFRDRSAAILNHPASTRLLVRRGDRLLPMTLERQAPSTSLIASTLVAATFSLVFWLVGTLISILVRPRDQRWLILVAFHYVSAVLFAAGFVSDTQRGFSSYVTLVCIVLFVPLVVHLHLILPNRAFPGLTRWLLPLLYGGAGVLITSELLGHRTHYLVMGLLPVGAVIFSLGIFLARLLRKSSPQVRAANRLMASGITLGLIPWLLAIALLPRQLFTDLPLGTSDAVLAAIALLMMPNWPLSYLLAIYKADAGRFELRANRALGGYGFWSLYILIFVFTFLLIASLGTFIANQPVIGSLLVSLPFVGFAPGLRRAFQRLIDRRIFGIRYSPSEVIRSFALRIPAAIDRDALRRTLLDDILPNLLIRQSALMLYEGDGHELLYSQAVDTHQLPRNPKELEDLLGDRSTTRSVPEQPTPPAQGPFAWVQVAVPLVNRGEHLGVWLLGRRDPNDDYPPQDVQTLRILANQIGSLHRSQLEHTENRRLQDQLVHSQKMEAIGRLSAGIAHDFNNLLSAILGYSDLLLSVPDAYDPVSRQYIEGIKGAGDKAAALTSQLLAFSRQQAMVARIIDLNQLVGHLETLLRRVIEEDIALHTDLRAAPASVYIDPGQMEQVVLNLAVNASDAMPGGGSLTLSTETAIFGALRGADSSSELAHSDVAPGRYVRLQVVDTGVGIVPEVVDRIFEPFFTTKTLGKGTGLGLSMVYGIITQSRGFVRVDSRPGHGTTFSIYLPEAMEDKVPAATPATPATRPREGSKILGSETILLVEDEASVRKVVFEILRSRGYQVLEAADGAQGLDLAERHDGPIDLVLTDVMMPVMKGPQMVERLMASRPDTAVVFMSGYSDEKILGDLVNRGDAILVRKPFTPSELARELRAVLDARHGSGVS